MKKKLLIAALIVLASSGCALLPATFTAAEETAATVVVQSAERTICRNIPIGTWRRLYGSHPTRAQAWRDLCANPIETPAGGA